MDVTKLWVFLLLLILTMLLTYSVQILTSIPFSIIGPKYENGRRKNNFFLKTNRVFTVRNVGFLIKSLRNISSFVACIKWNNIPYHLISSNDDISANNHFKIYFECGGKPYECIRISKILKSTYSDLFWILRYS